LFIHNYELKMTSLNVRAHAFGLIEISLLYLQVLNVTDLASTAVATALSPPLSLRRSLSAITVALAIAIATTLSPTISHPHRYCHLPAAVHFSHATSTASACVQHDAEYTFLQTVVIHTIKNKHKTSE
jgi:hypothetical protein